MEQQFDLDIQIKECSYMVSDEPIIPTVATCGNCGTINCASI
ncbi:FDLD family class I lanthipeptide [Tumebacillus sp. ITR2]|uniref:FDLD family class I lanthipeptide n=1 Tax=Tumebacillus amylolyticus TaxID=2801339 RepID=A0ABS1JEL9_9BACL|nr:FDLD family class I lanthipeptide [Tumebacillus amylolyticus]MBL0388650.1 FDLD family class I lanthipeptide [Tumebacillus amylolyticus]